MGAFWTWVDEILFGWGLPLLLLGVGLAYFLALRAFPYLHPLRTLRYAVAGGSRSALRALSVALGGTLGVGNITGVALALAAGGAGALFWMWVSAAVAMFLKYGEIVLALLTRKRGADGTWEGGAMFYLKGRGGAFGRFVAGTFALLCLLCAFTLGAPVQSNAAALAAKEVLGISPILTGGLLVFLTALAIFGGVRKIGAFTERIIPFMSFLYLFLSLYATLSHLSDLPAVLGRVFSEAFTLSAGVGGAGGFLASRAVRYGVTRGLLSHEAGAGTAPMAHAVAENTPAKQGIMGVFEVAIDTFVFCSATAIPLLIAYKDGFPSLSGMGLVTKAFSDLVGPIAPPLLAISVFLFAYATVLAWCYYGKRAIGYLTASPMAQKGYLYGYVALVGAGALLGEGVLWNLTDGVISLLTMLHTACLFPLLPAVLRQSRAEGIVGNGIRLVGYGKSKSIKHSLKVLGGGSEKGKTPPVVGVGKGKAGRMEHRAGKTVSLPSIEIITEQREPKRGKM